MKRDHLIGNRTYDTLKKVVMLGLPGFATFYAALAVLWSWPNSEAVVGTCAALATFLGVLLTISDTSWNKSENKFDGEVKITGVDPDTGNPVINLTIKDPNVIDEKDYVRLKAIDLIKSGG